MNLNDFKIYILNTATIFISFTNIESVLKILLLLVSIIYTFLKIYQILKKNSEKN